MLEMILIFAAGLALGWLFTLYYEHIISWFTGRQNLKESDRDNIAFTLQENLRTGKYKTVQGIFNKRTNTVLDGTGYESQELDSRLKEVHAGSPLVVYN